MRGRQVADRFLTHYTTSAGLLGMIESRSIWASHIGYLNDASEFRYAFDTARDIVERINVLRERHAPRSPELARLITEETNHLERGSIPNVFVASFSESGEDLSQWRGYTRPGDGYTILCSLDAIKGAADARTWRLEPVLYGTAADSKVASLAQEAFLALEGGKYATSPEPECAAFDDFRTALARCAPTLKDAAFQGEREWRLISPPYDYWSPEVQWRPGPSYLVPFVEFPLGEPDASAIRGFGVGPGPNGELASSALLMMINQKGYRVGVAMPGMPYRPW
jgi:hypothetical protein